jgi:hypothetical protein
MARIDHKTHWAVSHTLLIKLSNGKTIEDTWKELGVTTDQWKRFQQTGVLKEQARSKSPV